MLHNNLATLRSRHSRRGRSGITQGHLARRVGVSRSYISKLEQGKLRPNIEITLRIAEYFECNVEDIFHCEQE